MTTKTGDKMHKSEADKRLEMWHQDLEAYNTLTDALHIAETLREACRENVKRWEKLLEMANKELTKGGVK